VGVPILRTDTSSGLATSFAPLAEKMNFTIMPNPSNGLVNIILPVAKSGLTINVLDAVGKVVYSEVAISTTVGDKKQLNLDFLPKGLYTINLKTATENSFSKIVLQ
ncbi:MAG: T9SS type A sorting domain-containing protein, partial [Candidatus Fonsibacter sp.]